MRSTLIVADSVNLLNMQYFAFYSPNPKLSIGMSPNITVNWNAPDGEKLTLPIGIGLNKTLFLGKLPVRLGAEYHYNIVHPDDNAHSPNEKFNLDDYQRGIEAVAYLLEEMAAIR